MAKYLVTSALPYANGPIHFGHVAGAYLPADVSVRYRRMRGDEVLYVCGTDEHGVAITLRAEQEGVGYREYVDRWHEEIKALFDRFSIDFDIFTGTARCPQHLEASQHFFRVLLEGGWIQTKTEKQWYSEKADRFLPDRYLQGICPNCGYEKARGDECPSCGTWVDARELKDPVSLIDGSRPVLKETLHWYLDLPRLYETGLANWFQGEDAERPHVAWKPNVAGYVQDMLRELRARPITRDLPWGVPVPQELEGAEGKQIYVWFEAPIGYISATMEWAEREGKPEAWREWWLDPDCRLVHFIGKDNIAFHVVLFPAMLLGQGQAWEGRNWVLPWAVPANEFYNLEGRKFSTSEGWYLDNDHFFSNYSADAARFHLILSGPENADSEFTWKGFQTTNNSLLADKLGNFASRVLKFCGRRFEGRVPQSTGGMDGHPSLAAVDENFGQVGAHLDGFGFKAAARALLAGCDDLNRFFDETQPWVLIKSENEVDHSRCADIIERCIAYLALLRRRLAPFCPTAAGHLGEMLGSAAAAESAGHWGEETAGKPPGRVQAGLLLGTPEVLFPKIDDEQIQAEIERLKSGTGSPA